MLRRIMPSVFAVALTATTACAADLPARSRIGAIFAEPDGAAPNGQRRDGAPVAGYALGIDISPAVPGYYGRRNVFHYAPYYGSSIFEWGLQLPYACGFYGYC